MYVLISFHISVKINCDLKCKLFIRFTILESSFRAKFWTQHCLYKEIKEDGKEGKIDLDCEFSEQDQSRTHKVGRWYRARVSSSRDRRDHVVDYHVLRSCMKSRRASLYASRRRSIQVTLDLREAGEARFFRRIFPPVMCTHAPRYPQAHSTRRTREGEAGGNVCRLVGAVLFAASDENGGHPDPLPPRLVYSYLTFPFLSFP